MSVEVITPPAKGWSAAAEKVLAGREVGAQPLTAGDFFRLQKQHKDPVDHGRAVVAAVVMLGDAQATPKELDALPVKDYLHVQRSVVKASGLSDLEDEAELDPK